MDIAYKLFQIVLAITGLAALPACATSYPPAYSAEAIEAWVIDAETKQPLKDVVVTANWELRGGATPGGSTVVGQLMVMEAVTDDNGRFYFPPWGPIRQFKGELHERDPQLILFKAGYEYKVLSNYPRFEAEAALEPVRRSRWSGQTIELKPYKGTIAEYAKRIYNLGNKIDYVLDLGRGDKECNWKKIPRMLIALDTTAKALEGQGVRLEGWRLGQHILQINDIPATEQCGNPSAFFQSHSR